MEAGRDTAQQGSRNRTFDNTPVPLQLQGQTRTVTNQGSTEHAQATTPVSTAHTPTVMSPGGASSSMPQGWAPSPRNSAPTPRHLSYREFGYTGNDTVLPSQDPKHGTVSTAKTMGVRASQDGGFHCRESGCEFPLNHTGVCSNEVEPDMHARVSRATSAARSSHG